jgi:RimJ/RimL family protein N-acetyltransferase
VVLITRPASPVATAEGKEPGVRPVTQSRLGPVPAGYLVAALARDWHNRPVTDQPPDFSVKPTLIGDRVVLRPFLLDQDASALREMLRDPEALKLTGSMHDPSDIGEWDAAAEARFSDWYSTRNQQAGRLDLAVVDQATGQCVGEAVLNDVDEGNHSCSFRIMLGPQGRDRGLGTESVRMIVGYGFEQLGMHRIALEVYPFNPRARRVYEKVGFVAEGVLREVLYWDGEWVDAVVMSILATDWAGHHGHAEAASQILAGPPD